MDRRQFLAATVVLLAGPPAPIPSSYLDQFVDPTLERFRTHSRHELNRSCQDYLLLTGRKPTGDGPFGIDWWIA